MTRPGQGAVCKMEKALAYPSVFGVLMVFCEVDSSSWNHGESVGAKGLFL